MDNGMATVLLDTALYKALWNGCAQVLDWQESAQTIASEHLQQHAFNAGIEEQRVAETTGNIIVEWNIIISSLFFSIFLFIQHKME